MCRHTRAIRKTSRTACQRRDLAGKLKRAATTATTGDQHSYSYR